MIVSNGLTTNKVIDIFSDPRVSQAPLPLEILTLIFSHLSELDLHKGLTTSYAWYAASLKVIQSDFNWLQRFAKFLKDQIPDFEWDLCLPTEEQFRKEQLTSVVLNSKDRFLEKLKGLPYRQIQKLALAACCNGYLDLQNLGHFIVNNIQFRMENRAGEQGFMEPAFEIGDQDWYLVLSDQDLSSVLSKDHLEWLKTSAIHARPLWAQYLYHASKFTIAMHVYVTLQMRFSWHGDEKRLPISNELIRASEKCAQETTVKSKALKTLATQLRTAATQPELGGSTLSSIRAKTCHTLSERCFRDLFVLSTMCKNIDLKLEEHCLESNWDSTYAALARLMRRSAIELASIDWWIEHMKLKGPQIFTGFNKRLGKASSVIFNVMDRLWKSRDDFEEKYIDYLIDKIGEMPEDSRLYYRFSCARDLQGEGWNKSKINSFKALKVLSLIFPEKTDKNLTWQEMIAEWDRVGDPYKEATLEDWDKEDDEMDRKFSYKVPKEVHAPFVLAGARILTRLVIQRLDNSSQGLAGFKRDSDGNCKAKHIRSYPAD